MKTPIPLSVTEGSEAEALFQFEIPTPEPAHSALGLNSTRIGGGVVVSMRNDPTEFWSRALGFGLTAPVTSAVISEVCDFYRAEGTRHGTIEIAPSLIPGDWTDICAREGLKGDDSLVKLVAEVDEVLARADAADRRPVKDLRIGPVGPGDAGLWGSVMVRAFEMPEEHFPAMCAAHVVRQGWHAFAAWLDGEMVGTGSMYHKGETANLVAGSMLPHARNRGGQSELIAARARKAAELGCRYLVVETHAETDGHHNTSLHNLLGLGFHVAYERQNWVWRPTD